jgi:ribosomal protein S18 acetylase RimI-like enzyme
MWRPGAPSLDAQRIMLVAGASMRQGVGMVQLRPAVASDGDFLVQVLQLAADWRPGSPERPVGEVLTVPVFAHYVVGWPRPGDLGVVAEDDDGTPLGATWCRALPADDPGFGFVAPDVPELTIGVVPEARGRGIGRRLLERLIAEASDRGIPRLSLSVELDNPAMALYERVGFVTVSRDDGAATMVLDVR